MRPERMTARKRFSVVATLATVALGAAVFAGDAAAACVTPGRQTPATIRPGGNAMGFALPAGAAQAAARGAIVGLWNTQFLLDDEQTVYDHAFQQFHGDGTELMLSNGLPPALGNVCIGVWERTGAGRVKLRHVAWNWNEDGSLAGTFVLVLQLQLDARGHAFEGRWEADNFDLDGNVIPELHFEGIARGTRITVD